MSDETEHGIDAEVPSETAQFDGLAGQQTDPELSEAQKNLVDQLTRFKNLAQALMQTPNAGPMLFADVYVNKALARAELIVLSKFVEEKLGVKPSDYIKEVAKQMEQALQLEEMEHKIVITVDGVFNG
jgi:hypothetical protein